ncbi:acyl-CoA dehydrogenase family protein [uncultured Methylobacterium sp.]|mgnify:CR=1 FL=1|jgi:alkylation response protein AidB-like acyl-CoA dehydrogenase|uniref:acyl-CoA dehydrogenase family protein n=1 Tax=uncultured Methylobacterium sp. TaxID=157278 RepID=UPI00262434BB|nr:acyl-CoA dehydrogenase family protein [uncultured Methylobacterium sp.]
MKIFEQFERSRGWSGDETLVLDQVRRLAADRIAPRAEHHDRTGEFPWDNVRALNDLGLNALFVPEAHGGAPMSYRLYLEVVKIVSEACASTGIIYATNFHGMKPLIDFGSDEQRGRLLPRIAEGGLGSLAITEPDAGSDATGMKTRFTPDGDAIVVEGGKTFITSGDVADLILLFGKWSEIPDPRQAISVLVLEKGTPGFEVVRREEKMGHHASSTATLAFNGCRVPRANLVGAPGDGLRILLASLNKSRPSVAAHALGIARAAFRDMIAYGNDRRQSGRRIVDYQGNQFLIADLASELAMTEVWLDHVAALVDGGSSDFGIEASIAKLRASDLAMRMATEAVQLHGGYGYCRDYRVERLMRDAKITQIWEGANQIHRQLIGRSFVSK